MIVRDMFAVDYRALSNAGQWCMGHRQTDVDRARVIDGIAASAAGIGGNATQLSNIIKRLSPRWFLMRNVHSDQGLVFLQVILKTRVQISG